MALRIHCSRAKIFMAPGSTTDRHGARKFMIGAGQTVAAPSWLRETATYKYGVKDGSVLDLTPPAAPVVPAAAPVAPEPEPEAAAPAVATAPADESEDEDRALEEANAAQRPQAQRAPKGVVRASAKKAQ